MVRLDNKVAIITGGNSGIGFAAAKRFIREGAKVAITGIADESGKNAAKELGKNAMFIHQDVSKQDQWEPVFKEVESKFGPVNILVNCAGIGVTNDIEHITFDQWHQELSINLDGTFLGTHYAVLHMKNNGGGSIVNISSILGRIGDPNTVAYNASKGGVKMMTMSAALYCAEKHYNIRINTVNPAYIKTPMVDQNMSDKIPELIKLHPMGRLGKPEEVANMILFLASDESSFSTGHEYFVDGGYTVQ